MLISIGASRYTHFGETTFLERGDRSIVALYDTRLFSLETLREHVVAADGAQPGGCRCSTRSSSERPQERVTSLSRLLAGSG
jgi:hypothetical protein